MTTPITEKIRKDISDAGFSGVDAMNIELLIVKYSSLIEKPEPMNDSGSSKPRLPIESVAQKPAEKCCENCCPTEIRNEDDSYSPIVPTPTKCMMSWCPCHQKPAEANPTKGWTPEVDEAARKAEKIFAPKEESSGWENDYRKKMSELFKDALTSASRFGSEMKGTQYEGMYPDKSIQLRDEAIWFGEALIRAELARQREEIAGEIEKIPMLSRTPEKEIGEFIRNEAARIARTIK